MTDRTDLHPGDWRLVVAEFQSLFADLASPGPSPVAGRNFMTEEVLGVVRDPRSGCRVEVSTGMFLGARLFGLTWARSSTGAPDPRDCVVHSLAEARLVLDTGEVPG